MPKIKDRTQNIYKIHWNILVLLYLNAENVAI